jgi:hypothetical protein
MIEILATKKRNEFIVATFHISPHRSSKQIRRKGAQGNEKTK